LFATFNTFFIEQILYLIESEHFYERN